MYEEDPAEVEHLAHRARMSPARQVDAVKKRVRVKVAPSVCSDGDGQDGVTQGCERLHLCLRLRWTRGGSSDGALKMDLKMGTYFLKRTAETVKFLSSLSVLRRKSCDRPAMSCHFLILLKNSIRLQDRREKE